MTLLNRWDRERFQGMNAGIDLLREGGLCFSHRCGTFGRQQNGARCVEVECLSFADGSCVMRLSEPGADSCASRWTAIAPVDAAKDGNAEK